jgi:hypothetical protein
VATVENMRINIAAPKSSDALALLCATPATDLRTNDVRSNVRSGQVPADKAIGANRVRVTATTTGMGHVGFGAGYVPGYLSWSPPI